MSYAPEYETVADLHEKFKARNRDVRYNLNKLRASADIDTKRKRDGMLENYNLPEKRNANSVVLM